MLPTPPPAFPTAYYAALASLVPLVWIALVFQAKINQDPWPAYVKEDPFAVFFYLGAQLIGLIGLPIMEFGVLLVLRDQQVRPWVEGNLSLIMIVSVVQIVAPVIWRVVQQPLPEWVRPHVEKWGSAALCAVALFFLLTTSV